jgi:hypothetical protein
MTLLPFREYSEHDVLNVYAASGVSTLNKGTLVKIQGDGFKLDSENPIEMLGNPSDFSPSNVVSQRYGVVPKVTAASAGNDVIGMTLFDVRETDENGELLKFRPRKAAEMEAVVSGQAVPLVRRGLFSYSGIYTGNTTLTGVVSAGAKLYVGQGGTLSTFASGTAVATALGATDSRGVTVIYLNIA